MNYSHQNHRQQSNAISVYALMFVQVLLIRQFVHDADMSVLQNILSEHYYHPVDDDYKNVFGYLRNFHYKQMRYRLLLMMM